jgi:TolB-like protein
MEGPFPAYQGSEPYVFVSYSHADADAVFTDLATLHNDGYRIWYDDGIRAGHNWLEALARAISDCSVFLFFASGNSATSKHCQRELHFAMDDDKPVIVVQLDDKPLPPTVKFVLGNQQALLKSELAPATFAERLRSALTEFIEPGPEAASPAPPSARRFDSLPHTSIGIVPFKARGQASNIEDLADFATEELGLLMSGNSGMRIAPDSSIRHAMAVNPDPVAIAESLGVGHVVEGSLRSTEDELQLLFVLIDASSGARVLSNRVSVPSIGGEKYLSHALDRIRILISSDINNRLLNVIADRPHEELDSIALTCRGLELWNRGDRSLEAAHSAFQMAIAADERNPWPKALLANLMAQMVFKEVAEDPDAYTRGAKEQLKESLELGYLQSRVLGMGSNTSMWLGDHEQQLVLAREGYTKIQSLGSRRMLANALIANGETSEASHIINEVDDCAPAGYERPYDLLCDLLMLEENWDAALEQANAARLIEDGHFEEMRTATVLMELDRIEAARDAVRRARAKTPGLALQTAVKEFARFYNNQPQFFRGLKQLIELETQVKPSG